MSTPENDERQHQAGELSEAVQAPFATDALERAIDEYLEDYEMVGETEDGRDASHAPTDGERILIKDAIIGLLADPAWDAEWGRLIEQRARAVLAAARPADVPQGWQLVPVEPTEAMEIAGMRGLRSQFKTCSGEYSREQAWAAYRAMLSAAPPPEGERRAEPVAWTTGIAWGPHQSEKIVKLTREPQPEHGFTIPLYAAQRQDTGTDTLGVAIPEGGKSNG